MRFRFCIALSGLRPIVFRGLLTVYCAALLTSAHGAEAADEGGTSDASGLLEQRLRSEIRVLLMDLVQSGAMPAGAGGSASVRVEAPAERASDLGVLVDTRSGSAAKDGLRVLGTTPGGLANRLGFRNGDVIVSVNDVRLADLGDDSDGSARAGHVLRDSLAVLDDGAALVFAVLREGKPLTLNGVKQSVLVPAFSLRVGVDEATSEETADAQSTTNSSSDCGWINTFDNAPRQQQLHAAVLISIDGEHAPLRTRSSYRVSSGRHVLKVGELIDGRYLGFSQTFRDRGGDDRYKTLTVEVEPNTAYSLGARLNSDHLNEWRDGKFWDPVIWSTNRENCR